MKTPPSLPVLLVAATTLAAVLTAPALRAADVTWTGSINNDWNNPGNWSSGSAPAYSNRYIISADGAAVTTSAASVGGAISVSGNGTTAPQLTITQNIGLNAGGIIVGSDSSGSGYGGVIYQTSGTVRADFSSAVGLNIAAAAGAATSGNTGSYYFGGTSPATAPVFSDPGTRGNVAIGARPGETGLLALSGYGTFTAGSVQMSAFNGSSKLRIEGGNLNISFSSITTNQYSGGSTVFEAVLTGSGISTINVVGAVALGYNTTFNLSLGNDFTATLDQQFTIINAGGGFTGSYKFMNVAEGALLTAGNYQFRASYLNNAFTLVTQAVPEPGSVALLGVGGFVLLFARRRRFLVLINPVEREFTAFNRIHGR